MTATATIDGRLTEDQRELMQQWHRLALWLAHRLSRRGVVARWMRLAGLEFDDLVGECVLRMAHAARRHDPARGSFSTLCTLSVERRVLQLAARATGRHELMPLDVEPLAPDSSDRDHEMQHAAAVVRAGLERLDESDRTLLADYYGLSRERQTLREQAEQAGVSRERIRQKRVRAEQRLRDAIQSTR